jgi:hypothetical protein
MERIGPLPKSETPREESATSSGDTHRARSHRRGRSRSELHDRIEKLEKRRLVLTVSLVALAVICLGLAIGFFLARSAASEAQLAGEAQRNRLELSVRESATRLAAVQRDLQEAQARIKEMVDERIPGLGALVLNRPVPVRQHFIRDISFGQVADAEARGGLEYKVVIENTSSAPIKPALSVQFFDEVGVQLGDSRPIEMRGDDAPLLRAGEIRSYFAVFDPPGSATPSYFRIVASK